MQIDCNNSVIRRKGQVLQAFSSPFLSLFFTTYLHLLGSFRKLQEADMLKIIIIKKKSCITPYALSLSFIIYAEQLCSDYMFYIRSILLLRHIKKEIVVTQRLLREDTRIVPCINFLQSTSCQIYVRCVFAHIAPCSLNSLITYIFCFCLFVNRLSLYQVLAVFPSRQEQHYSVLFQEAINQIVIIYVC